jgi:hypothetical protein
VQLVAMITMLVDHFGKAFFPDQMEWRIVGRMAFPIYAYLLVLGYQRTSNLKRYLLRLTLIGILSQYPFMIALDIKGINAVGTLLISLLALIGLDTYKSYLQRGLILIASAILLEFGQFDYGMYGLLLVCIYRYTKFHRMVALHLLLNLVFVFLKGWLIESFSVIATICIAYAPNLFGWIGKLRIPRWLWLGFYPIHLTVLMLVEMLLLTK